MVFSELYSVYYNTVAKILAQALKPGVTEKELQRIVTENAFSESVMSILPALKSGKWQLMGKELGPVVCHRPTMPLTTLEKRWLKSLSDDPRLRLFDIELTELEEVEPLFTREDYRVYDQYSDGDPFEDESYIQNFRLIREAIGSNRPVKVSLDNRFGKEIWVRFYPTGFEYSLKDDKLRILAANCKFRHFNLGRLKSCEFYTGHGPWREQPKADCKKELCLEIEDERNALERAMLHFAHFEKQAERVGDRLYRLRLKYHESDETEMVIRILSFGPLVRVVEPESFVELIKERLKAQKICEL